MHDGERSIDSSSSTEGLRMHAGEGTHSNNVLLMKHSASALAAVKRRHKHSFR